MDIINFIMIGICLLVIVWAILLAFIILIMCYFTIADFANNLKSMIEDKIRVNKV